MYRLGFVSTSFAVGLLASLALGGCSGSDGSTFQNRSDETDGGGAKAEDGVFADPKPTDVAAEVCAAETKLVYVLSAEMGLHRFDPSTLTFTKVGTLDCPDPGPDVQVPREEARPNSMAIDRSGTAWVNYTSGKLFKVSTRNASCEATSYEVGQHGIFRMGMAFATDPGSTTQESLYVVGIDSNDDDDWIGKGLARLDTTTLKIAKIGDFSNGLRNHGAELTGTGDGRLFGFVAASANGEARLAGIEMANGQTPTDGQFRLRGVNTGSAFAFSFWGGDFWFYTSETNRPSQVTQYAAGGDGKVGVVMQDVGFRIVGAGTSTCAPTTRPR